MGDGTGGMLKAALSKVMLAQRAQKDLAGYCAEELSNLNRQRVKYLLPPAIVVLLIIDALFFYYSMAHEVDAKTLKYIIATSGYTFLLICFYFLIHSKIFQSINRFAVLLHSLCLGAMIGTAALSIIDYNMTTYIINLFLFSTLIIIDNRIFSIFVISTLFPLMAFFLLSPVDSSVLLPNFANVFFSSALSIYISFVVNSNTLDNIVNKKIIEQKYSELDHLTGQFKILSETDALTQLNNRRKFDEIISQEWNSAMKVGKSLSLILFDADFFKHYNDKYGHMKGDECLAALGGALLEKFSRPEEFVARYGGEEFAIVIAGAGVECGTAACERLLEAVRALKIFHAYSEAHNNIVTVSAGLASCAPGPGDSLDDFIGRADSALYQAKKMGRDRYALAGG